MRPPAVAGDTTHAFRRLVRPYYVDCFPYRLARLVPHAARAPVFVWASTPKATVPLFFSLDSWMYFVVLQTLPMCMWTARLRPCTLVRDCPGLRGSEYHTPTLPPIYHI